MDGVVNWNELDRANKERIRREMTKNLVRTVKARFPNKSGRICYGVAISMVDRALKAEEEKHYANGCPILED